MGVDGGVGTGGVVDIELRNEPLVIGSGADDQNICL
jgi:hypothetical protein